MTGNHTADVAAGASDGDVHNKIL
jgi:hypothetical protein